MDKFCLSIKSLIFVFTADLKPAMNDEMDFGNRNGGFRLMGIVETHGRVSPTLSFNLFGVETHGRVSLLV
jgi:hypothetical protein